MSTYIFLGPEQGKKQDEVDAIKKKLPASVETSSFYCGETSVITITDTLQNHSLFAEARLIILKNAELLKKKDEVDSLVSCIETLDEDTTFILLSDETKLAAALENSVPKNNKQIFYEMFEKEKTEWLKQLFLREGYKITPEGISTILEMVENNTDALRRDCSRLMLFLPKDKTIIPDDIEKWLSHNREESAFTLFSRIAAGDISKSLESLAVLLASKESPVSILAGLAWCFRKLRDYLLLIEKGSHNNFTELRNIGLSSPKVKEDYINASRRYNLNSVETCLALTSEADISLKSPLADLEKIIMDKYILSVISPNASL